MNEGSKAAAKSRRYLLSVVKESNTQALRLEPMIININTGKHYDKSEEL